MVCTLRRNQGLLNSSWTRQVCNFKLSEDLDRGTRIMPMMQAFPNVLIHNLGFFFKTAHTKCWISLNFHHMCTIERTVVPCMPSCGTEFTWSCDDYYKCEQPWWTCYTILLVFVLSTTGSQSSPSGAPVTTLCIMHSQLHSIAPF